MFFYKPSSTKIWLESPLHASIKNSADTALRTLRTLSGRNILANVEGSLLLDERAMLMNLKFPAQISANGSCYLLETKDKKWIALNLSRKDDWEMLPALFKISTAINNIEHITSLVNESDSRNLVNQGRALGLPLALAEQPEKTKSTWFDVVLKGGKQQTSAKENPLVIDLSSLWAGPLCSRLLQLAGARVIKVEASHRPDGAGLNTQKGGREFYELLNSNKEIITLNFNSASGIDELKQLIQEADIVIEGSRPRALQQLGINAEEIVQKQNSLIWISITGYGRREPQCHWVAFGDDAAISAGLFHTINNKPVFIGDAIADPLTGLHAAVAALTFWQRKESVLLDINLHAVAKYCAAISTSQTFD